MSDAELARLVALAQPWAIAVGLAMARASGLVLGLPTMSGRAIPRMVQAIVVLALAIAAVGARPGPFPTFGSPVAFVVAAFGELVLGLALGFVLQLALAAVRMAGDVAGIEMGLSFAAVADPLTATQSTAVTTIMGQLGVQLALALGLDHAAVRALVASLDHRPLGDGGIARQTAAMLVSLGDVVLTAAVELALPLVGALLCLKLAMAMLARVAPRLQIFTLAFALAIGVGLLILRVALPGIGASAVEHLQTFFGRLALLAREA